MIDTVVLDKTAIKSLRRSPRHVAAKLAGKRSIRLSKAYRAIYVIKADTIEFVLVEDVSNHYGD